jgi:hypothetical protein
MKKLETSLSFIFTSRPHIELSVQFQSLTRLEISASESDIETYLDSEINHDTRLQKFIVKDPELKGTIIQRVISNATGMLVLAT